MRSRCIEYRTRNELLTRQHVSRPRIELNSERRFNHDDTRKHEGHEDYEEHEELKAEIAEPAELTRPRPINFSERLSTYGRRQSGVRSRHKPVSTRY